MMPTCLFMLLPVAAPQPAVRPLFDCDTAVDGTALVTEPMRQGAGAVRWRDHPNQSAIHFPVPADWTGYHLLRFWLYSARPVETSFMVIVFSENPATEGADYWGYKVGLGFVGWKEIILPIGQRGGTRSPLGWDQVNDLMFTASGWSNVPHAEADLVIDDLRLEYDPPRPGPRMTDEAFFANLDLTRPELRAVAQAVAANDLPAAKQALLAHFRARERPRWWFDQRDRPQRDAPLTGGSDGWDYFGTNFAIDWTGWKELVIPLEQFGRSREPLGWHQINYLGFSATYGDRRPSPRAVLVFDQIELIGDDGSLVLADFETPADLERWPGLSPSAVVRQVGERAGQWARLDQTGSVTCRDVPADWRGYQALRAWVWSAEATGDVITVIADSDTPDTRRADEVMAHRRDGFHLGDDIDWEANKLPPTEPAFTREWTYTLNRFGDWVVLADAYWATGDEKYAVEWIAQMRDWVEDNPYLLYGTGNDTLTWRTIEAGIRTSGSWPTCLYRFHGSPSLTGDDLVVFLKSWIEHAHHLMRITVEHPEHGGNWVTMECNGLGHLGILLPECRDAGLWLDTALERMSLELERQVYPDGAQKELTTGYHQVARSNFAGLMRFARHNDRPVPAAYLSRLERMYRYNLLAADGQGFLPPLNDAGYTGVAASLREAAELFDDPLYAWAASGGTQGEPPTITSLAFPWAGHYIMRSGWGPQDLYLLFEAGPFGTGHQHEDKLTLCLTAFGRRLLTEAGTYSYDQSKYRRYVLGTWAHNTVLVDGLEQHRRGLGETYESAEPLDNRWLTSDAFDAADGVYDHGYGPDRAVRVRHQRTVVFVKPDYFVVVDRLTPEDDTEHRYDILWHLGSDRAAHDAATQAAWSDEPDAPNLLVTPATRASLGLEIVVGREDPVLGFAPASRHTPIAVLNYQAVAAGPATLAWVLTPYEDQRPEVAAEVAEADGTVTVTVRRPGGDDRVTVGETVTVVRQPGAR